MFWEIFIDDYDEEFVEWMYSDFKLVNHDEDSYNETYQFLVSVGIDIAAIITEHPNSIEIVENLTFSELLSLFMHEDMSEWMILESLSNIKYDEVDCP